MDDNTLCPKKNCEYTHNYIFLKDIKVSTFLVVANKIIKTNLFVSKILRDKLYRSVHKRK